MHIYLTATLTSKPEFTEEVKAFLQHMVTESRKDEGCILYNLHQGMDDKNLFIFQEIWESKAALDEHNRQPHIAEFLELAETKLQMPPAVYLANKI
ncbi:putative monooxygenase [compost metagenome]